MKGKIAIVGCGNWGRLLSVVGGVLVEVAVETGFPTIVSAS